MKSKFISFVLGFVIGAFIFSVYVFFISSPDVEKKTSSVQQAKQAGSANGGGYVTGNFDQRRKERLAERMGITLEDLEKELESGKTIEKLMEEKGIEMPMRGRGFGTGANDKGHSGRIGTGEVGTGTIEKSVEDYTGSN